MAAPAAKVKSIFVYPIKSCRGISVAHQAPIVSTGFRWDRQWVVVSSEGRAYTQRVEPKLALVQVQLPSEAFSLDWKPNNYSYLVVKAPGMEVLKVPLLKSSSAACNNKVDGGVSVSVWEWSGSALDEGDAAAQWFSSYLGKPSRLVRFNDASEVRNADPNYARGHKLMFSDQYPFLLLSQGSLNALNARLKEPVPINRFRPNIVVDGCEPFSEDLWTEMKINDSTFQGVKLCSRGKVPTINQETGAAAASENITHTLTTFRSDKALRPNKNQQPGKVYFGLNLVCNTGKGKSIKVGDPVFVLRKVSSAAEAAA